MDSERDDVPPTAVIPSTLPADVTLTLAMFSKAVSAIGLELIKLAHEWDAGLYENRYSYADMLVSPSEWPILPRRVVSLPKAEAFESSKIGHIVTRAHQFIRSQMPLLARLGKPPSEMFADIGHDAFLAFFDSPDLFSMPKTICSHQYKYWMDDTCFADQFLNGCNPTVIEAITSVEQANRCMPNELMQCTDPAGRSVSQLISETALFCADYSLLAEPGIASQVHSSGSFINPIHFDAVSTAPIMNKHFYAPFVAFYKKYDGHLGVLGIVLTRFQNKRNEVYNRVTCEGKPNIYAFAKMHVACADNQMHQFYSHLGRTHLVFEPFGVAAHNIFQLGSPMARCHIVGKLLAQHFKDHIAINWLARNTLIAHGEDVIPFTDAGFALGSHGGIKLLAAKFGSWTLQDQAFPAQIRARGFDPEGGDSLLYYYRDDGMRIWRALERYVMIALEDFYSSSSDSESLAECDLDSMVAEDAVLDEWCEEMRSRDKAAVKSFPEKFSDIMTLCETVSTIIYNVSAEHSAVNSSQERYLSYVPNRPNALFKPVPSPSEPDMELVGEVLAIHRARGDDDDIGASMPLSFALFQVQFSQLLSLQPTTTLIQLEPEGVGKRAIDQLKYDLNRAHYEIRARNFQIESDTPQFPPYEFLDPALIAQSIEI